MALLLIGFSWYNQPSKEQMEAYQRQQDSIAAAQAQAEQQRLADEQQRAEAAAAAAKGDTTSLFYQALTGTSEDVVLKNEKVRLTFSTKGGMLSSAQVLGFKDRNGADDVTLFTNEGQRMNILIAGKDDNVVTEDLFFTPSNVTDSTLTMTASAADGGKIVIDYRLHDDHLLHIGFRAQDMSRHFAPTTKQMAIEWQDSCRQQEKGFMFENRYATLTYKKHDGKTKYLSETSEKSITTEEALDWVAFKNQFFSAVLIAKDEFAAGAQLTSKPQEKGSGFLKHYDAQLQTVFDPSGVKATELEMYIGPNDFRLLQHVEKKSEFGKDLDLQQLVYLGWPLFRIINRWFTIYVFDWLTKLGFSMGIVLILITLLLKAITYPMVKKSYMSSAKMRVLKPKLEEATKQYDKPEDQMQKQQAMMQLYSQ